MDIPAWLFVLLASVGTFYVSIVSFRVLAQLAFCMRRPKDLRRQYGTWAVVTGPTSGIGQSMALELARLGLNLVLVGRDPAKLRDISEMISRTHSVQTRTVVMDFSLASSAQGMRRLWVAIDGLDVGLLVNNAGVVKPGAVYMHEVDVEVWVRMIRVNVLALTEVTAAILTGMMERSRGAVVNIGSGSGSALPSYPLYSVYAGTKRYVAEFSKGLCVEYKSRGIDVQCQVVFLVETNMMSSAVKASFAPQFVLTSDAYARAAVRWIGYGALCVPSAAHRVQWYYTGMVPELYLDLYRLQMHLRQRDIFWRLRLSRKSQRSSLVSGCAATDTENDRSE